MSKKYSRKNYVRDYKEHFNINWKSGEYSVHHLDFDRDNGRITNLLLLPYDIHAEYHNLLNGLPENFNIITSIPSLVLGGHYYNSFLLERLTKFIAIQNICIKYHDYKDFLMGIIPNIHNIELKKE